MSDFAVSDEQVKITLAKEREKAASEEFDVDTRGMADHAGLGPSGKSKRHTFQYCNDYSVR